jgi:dienelactone hydrolase
MTIQTQQLDYSDENITLEACYAYEDSHKNKRPLVLVFHDWSGRNEFAGKKAEKLAELGYVGFAIDMFGKGKQGKTNDERSALIKPLMADRSLLRKRVLAALAVAKEIELVNANKIGAIGFCFGGLCALDLARSGVDVAGVVSFHGLLQAPANVKKEKIQAKILALHGYNDPMCPPEQVLAFQKEMTEMSADWQMNIYGNTMHAFTNPLANDPGFGTVYNSLADKRSWMAMKDFFSEIFT